MNKLALVILLIIFIGTAGFFFLQNQRNDVTPSLSATPTISILTVVPTNMISEGESYQDPNNVYTFSYPKDYTLDTQDPLHIRIYKRGQTQRPQSEMSDGALMVFENIDLKGKSLESWVDANIQQSTSDGTSEIIEEKTSIHQNGYPGFYYAIRGLGTSQNIILQKDSNSSNAVIITYAVSDPQEKGYQNEIDNILSSFRFIN